MNAPADPTALITTQPEDSSDGSEISAEKKSVKSLIEKPDKDRDTSEPKSGPPSLDDWQDFIGRFLIRGLTEAYVAANLADVYDELTPREIEQVSLSAEDLKETSAPLASLANKSKLARKHGRAIIATADSLESLVALAIWARRVKRIARKHRGPGTSANSRGGMNGNSRQNVGERANSNGTGDSYIPPNFYNPGTG